MPVLPKPTAYTNWTVGNPNFGTVTIEPTAGKKQTGWTPGERPPAQYMNWLFYNTDQWIDYLESITDDHETRIDAIEAALPGLGTAAGISASNTGHTYLTGVTVQAQLDQTDTFLEDIVNSITQGKGADLVGYIVGTPVNWDATIPAAVGDALDQLALRVRTLENSTQIGDFIDASFDDYVKEASDNTGFTDNSNTNPRGIKVKDLRAIYGQEVIEVGDIALTGNYDANGLPEYEITAPKKDPRVRFYGTGWHRVQDNHKRVFTSVKNDYFLVTGVFDSFGFGAMQEPTVQSNNIDVQVDGVDTGVNLTVRGMGILTAKNQQRQNYIVSDATLKNLGIGLHTVKVINDSSDAGADLSIYTIHLMSAANGYQVGGKAWVQQSEETFSNAAISAPTVGNKGARVVRYIDRTDQTIKDTVNNCRVFETSASSIGSGASSASVNSADDFLAGDIVLITDGANNSELIRVSSVNTLTDVLTFATTTQNAYTNATVSVWGRTGAAVNHVNEVPSGRYLPQFYGVGAEASSSYLDPAHIENNGPYAGICDDGASGLVFENHGLATHGMNGTARHIYCAAANNRQYIKFVGTGIDLLMSFNATPPTMIFILDGVPLASLSLTASKALWYKIASDLPEGEHTLVIETTTGGSGEGGIVQWEVYETKQSATALALKKGNILSSRRVLGSFVFLDQPVAALDAHILPGGRGVVRQHFQKNTGVFGTGWVENASIVSYDGGHSLSSNVTSDRVVKWFYGTGVVIFGYYSNNRGISQVKIDGNNASSANFPTQTHHGDLNSANGQWDQYAAANKTGVAGLSGLTEGWHKLEIEVTGTKNVSSSDYYTNVQCADVIGMPFESGVLAGSGGIVTPFALKGGVQDLRRLEPSAQWSNEEPNFVFKRGDYNSLTLTSTAFIPYYEMIVHLETRGGPVEIDYSAIHFVNGVGPATQVELLVDGVLVSDFGQDYTYVNSPNTNYQHQHAYKRIVQLPAGKHVFHLLWLVTSGTGASSGNTRRMSVKELPMIQTERVA